MTATETTKKQVKIGFYYMSVGRKKKADDTTPYDISAVSTALSAMLTSLMQKERIERKHDFSSKEKTIWLDNFSDLGNGNYDIVFMSARYNRSRNVINTETMEEKGMLKQPEDGDEEKTHFCIRLQSGQDRFMTVVEQNFDGVTYNEIKWYLDQQLEAYHTETNAGCVYTVDFDIVLSKDFLTELKKMSKINFLTLTVDKSDPSCCDFLRLAGRDGVRDTVEICLHKKRGKGNEIPFDLIEEYFNETGTLKRIRKISIQGSNNAGSLKIDTDSIQLKHSIEVGVFGTTNEVDSDDFFAKVKSDIPKMGG
ncbi:MAG: hypothetical protein PHE09_13525 [Oscillospiraceae bacterium]|nr:hypothetical protein [Oscillospiraceae bacterium]